MMAICGMSLVISVMSEIILLKMITMICNNVYSMLNLNLILYEDFVQFIFKYAR